jgi:hypothetical protein
MLRFGAIYLTTMPVTPEDRMADELERIGKKAVVV